MIIQHNFPKFVIALGILTGAGAVTAETDLTGKWTGSLSSHWGGEIEMEVAGTSEPGKYTGQYEYSYTGWGGCTAVMDIVADDDGFAFEVVDGDCDRNTKHRFKFKGAKLVGKFPIPSRIQDRGRGTLNRRD